MTLSDALFHWRAGRRHGFPPCCRARFLLDRALPQPRRGLARLTPRRAIADGMVPCEYHLVRRLLDGDRSRWRRRRQGPPSMCCEVRADLEAAGAIALRRKGTLLVDELEASTGERAGAVWMLGLPARPAGQRHQHPRLPLVRRGPGGGRPPGAVFSAYLNTLGRVAC